MKPVKVRGGYEYRGVTIRSNKGGTSSSWAKWSIAAMQLWERPIEATAYYSTLAEAVVAINTELDRKAA